MTEEEWDESDDPEWMLNLLRTTSPRKLRLFAVECSREIWHLLKFEVSRQAILTAERFAEAVATENELEQAQRTAHLRRDQGLGGTRTYPASRCAYACADAKPFKAAWIASRYARQAENRKHQNFIQCGLLRDIFGNPFRPVAFSPSWRTSTAIGIATQMYDSREFHAMPILADALQDAGCEDDGILNHCRDENGIHVRGCWVVDLVLGKN